MNETLIKSVITECVVIGCCTKCSDNYVRVYIHDVLDRFEYCPEESQLSSELMRYWGYCGFEKDLCDIAFMETTEGEVLFMFLDRIFSRERKLI